LDCLDDSDMMEYTNSLKLGVTLNYTVFLYDICELVEEARFISKKAFDLALDLIEALNKNEQKESLPIMQLLY
jgi:14-3-3 protein epsilon